MFLMCPPEYYAVSYDINPWMTFNIDKVDRRLALKQWRKLYDVVRNLTSVCIMNPQPSCPDMVFTANAGIIHEDTFIASRFAFEERQFEEIYFVEWFRDRGFDVVTPFSDIPFEGAGDMLQDSEKRWWLGYGHRTTDAVRNSINQYVGKHWALKLVDPRFYHLDTCFCPLDDGYVMYYPQAFEEGSRGVIEFNVPAEKRIVVEEQDAITFACNAVCFDKNIVVNRMSTSLLSKLTDVGFTVHQTDLSEFIKSGGSAKCLTLRID